MTSFTKPKEMGKENDSDNTKKRRKSVSGNSGISLKDGDIYKVISLYTGISLNFQVSILHI